MKRAVALLSMLAAAAIECAAADQPGAVTPTLLNEVRAACQSDAQNLCAGVQAGGGRILSCLAQHKDAVSDSCKQALMKARQAQGQGPGHDQSQGQIPTTGPSPTASPAVPEPESESKPGSRQGSAAVAAGRRCTSAFGALLPYEAGADRGPGQQGARGG